MSTVHILMKHPPHPYSRGHIEAGVIVSLHTDKSEAQKIAGDKNKRSMYLYAVHTKRVKEQA